MSKNEALQSIAEHFIDSIRFGVGSVQDALEGDVCVICFDSLSPACESIANSTDFGLGRPIPLICDYRVPGWIDSNTAVILVSELGTSPRVQPVLRELKRRHCKVRVVCGGMAPEGFSRIPIPDGPRSEKVAFVIGAVFALTGHRDAVDAALSSLTGQIPGLIEQSSTLTEELRGGTVAAYGTTDVHACAVRWKDTITELLGVPAFCGELPEFDHNELVGWSDPNTHAPELSILVLRSANDGSLASEIVGYMIEVLNENGRRTTIADLGSGSPLERNLKGMLLADMTSYSLREVRNG